MSFRQTIKNMPLVGSAAYFLRTAATKQLFNPVVFIKTLGYLPRFLGQFSRFRRMARESGIELDFKRVYPVLVDYGRPVVNKHYWFQDIYVATKVIERSRAQADFLHIDIGSRLEGFITSLISAGVPLIFGDINLPNITFPNATARFIDLQKMTPDQFAGVGSVSCLHVIEHLGLGKYGDAIDPIGHRRVFADFGRVLERGCRLYISSPVSRTPGVVFNGGRHLDAEEMLRDAAEAGFEIEESAMVQDDWSFVVNPGSALRNGSDYGCLILCLRKS